MSNEIPIPASSPADAIAPVSERCCKEFKREVKLYGLAEAMKRWRVVCDYMQVMDWWSDVAGKVEGVIDKILEEQENQQKAERESQYDSNPVFIINNENGNKQVDQLNGVVEPGAEVTHTKHN